MPTQKILITSFVPLRRLIATSNSARLRVQVKPLPDTPRAFELLISPAKMPVGEIKSEITVVPESATGERLPGYPLPVIGRTVSDVQASPPGALFGARQVGEVVEETVTLNSLSGRRFHVIGTTVEADDLTVEQSAGEPQFLLKQRITRAGEQSGRIVFRARTAEGEDTSVTLDVSYLGIQAESR